MHRLPFFLLFLLLGGCSSQMLLWNMRSIETGFSSFDAFQLTYQNPQGDDALKLHLLVTEENAEVFLSLTSYQFRAPLEHPNQIRVTISIENESKTEYLPLLKGNMKIKLSENQANNLILALREGKSVDILAGSFSRTILSGEFQKLYDQMQKKSRMTQIVNKFI